MKAHGGTVSATDPAEFNIQETPRILRDLLPVDATFKARFELPVAEGVLHLNRTHPVVENLATFVMDTALDPMEEGVAHRCGVIRTHSVERRTTLLLLRMRFSITSHKGDIEHESLAEECRLLAFEGSPENPTWLDEATTEQLLGVTPDQNVPPPQAARVLETITSGFITLKPALEDAAQAHAEQLLEAHERVRVAARARGRRPVIEPFLPVDVLGLYVFLPIPKSGS